jgi:predicted transporter
MDINLVLWMGGMLFSLSIFVVKVGFGLGLGQLRWKAIFLTLFSYLGIFILVAVFSASFIKILEPLVRKGPYLHASMALGMIAWGIYVIRKLPGQGGTCGVPSCRPDHQAQDPARVTQHSALFLLLPCPVCLTAITFSTWAALNVIKLPALVVGLGLGITFIILSLLVFLFVKIFTLRSNLLNKRIALGLSMIGIGLYFLTSLVLPAHIEAAKSIYQSFVTEGSNIALSDHIGVFLLLLGAILVGFFTNKRREVSE